MTDRFVRVSMTLPRELLDEFDEFIKKRKYFKRSEAIRDALRFFVTENRWRYEEDARFIGALLLMYDHDVSGISDYLTHIQHTYHENIKSAVHIHLDKHKCLEILAVEGRGSLLRDLADEIGHRKGVEMSKLVLVK
ncbi:MAG: nickel-responsive transcriptional regulator NikR [Candidatus Odinarchaeum yellowstonii]|uniref:Putative nickel-responsive regulator n=1 Tax=Odinarchaeota yellowstonii (strain LCB_4) TaxID=1841599 RepID=A0AAF0IAN2_ODILC|nr:MAG: nickel-responsive transcriptional regulator NikR [Candidatus Odinarchaeum yellowstonii]